MYLPDSRSERRSNNEEPFPRPSRQLYQTQRIQDYFFRPSGASNDPSAVSTSFHSIKISKSIGSTHRRPSTNDNAIRRREVVNDNSRMRKKDSSMKPSFLWIKGELLGWGSYAKVYMGFIATTGELIAVKQVERPQTASDHMSSDMKRIVDALLDERETLKDLEHRNIVQFLGFEQNLETLNIFLEYVSGGTIHSLYTLYGRFRPEVTQSFTSQILQGLAYLHSRRILHRDLKSENILVEESGVCKISDFGISKKLVERARAFSAIGTLYWMAPEVFCGGNGQGYDSKIDIWSVGCLVFEMWTARRPWYNEELLSLLSKKMQTAPPLPDDLRLSEDAERFKDDCFQIDPSNRPSASELVNHPYLTLPQWWTFPGLTEIGNKPLANSLNATNEDLAEFFSQTIRFNDPEPATLDPQSPAVPMGSEVLFNAPTTPPLVFIEPPGSRKHNRIERERSHLESTLSPKLCHQSPLRKSRRLVIHNPDNDLINRNRSNISDREPFVYIPPPLPQIDGEPYSNHLAPLSQMRFTDPEVKRDGNHPRPIVMEHLNFRSRLPPPDGSDNGTVASSSTWKRPPEGITSSNGRRKNGRPSVKHEHVRKQSSVMCETRPKLTEVLKNLENFFPGHNLNEPVEALDDFRTFDGDRLRNKRYTLKSVKTIAEERINLGRSSLTRKRQTRLWDSHIEEIKAPR